VLDLQPAARGTHRAVRPTGEERTFSADELIVSKTDPRGIITYANDVFLRISAYSMAEVVGQPHNLIRHPEMPRAVFELLWSTLSEGRELFAYINNLASDGAHYWVLAHVTPSYGPDGRVTGYHSNRRKPSPKAIAQIEPLYDRLRAEERRYPNAKAAVGASSQLLAQIVAEQAGSYEDLIWSIINREES
jgi:PAS domain S-box-containing protein